MPILEDPHGNYIDRHAFDAAYRALSPHTRHAQIRADIAEQVVVAVVKARTAGGLAALTDAAGRAEIVTAVRAGCADWVNPPTRRAVDAAVEAAAGALLGE